jgi:hypothetical protein
MFGWRDLDYWLKGWEEGRDCETRYACPTQEAMVATDLPSVIKEKSVKDWYQSGGATWGGG